MRIAMIVSAYRDRGGEEISTECEAELLRNAGHDVNLFKVSSFRPNFPEFKDNGTDIIHVQNFFPFVNAWHFDRFVKSGIPVVVSLRNYRLSCMAATHWRQSKPCHECSPSFALPGVLHGCYQESRAKSVGAFSLLGMHKMRRTWLRNVSAFVAVSEEVRSKSLEFTAGRPVFVKPNTVISNRVGRGAAGTIIYAGRLAPEKGIANFAEVWSEDATLPMLDIIGGGPDYDRIAENAARSKNVRLLGPRAHEEVLDRIADALVTICPWRWNEPFGRVLMESLAVGTPVLASSAALRNFTTIGPAVSLLRSDSSEQLKFQLEMIRERGSELRNEARRAFDENFGPNLIIQTLTEMYESVLGGSAP